MTPEDRRAARSTAVFHHSLQGRVHFMTEAIGGEYYYDFMRPVGERLGVTVALCPLLEMGRRPAGPDEGLKRTYDANADIVIGLRSLFAGHLQKAAFERLLGQETPRTGTTIASGAVAVVEDDRKLVRNLMGDLDRAMFSLYDQVIVLPPGSVTEWPIWR